MKRFFQLTVLLFMLIPFGGEAKIIPWTQGIIHTVGGVQNSSSAECSVGTYTQSYYDRYKKGLITLGVDHHYGTTTGVATGTTVVELHVSEWTSSSSSTSSTPNATENITLEVTYNPNGSLTFRDKHTAEITGWEKYKITITSITVDGTTVTNLPANLYIQADLHIDRVFDFGDYIQNPSSYPANLISHQGVDTDNDGIQDMLRVSWTGMTSAEEYQLEWLFINDYETATTYKDITDPTLAFNFKFNSTRVSINTNSYDIPLIYDHGYICYRVRGVGRKLSDINHRIYTDWSSSDEGTVSGLDQVYPTEAFELSKNWQASITYAEEGKKKEVVSFYDGTLRNRQTVTAVSTDKHAVVGETIYDHLGRPAVQVLPAPVYAADGTETVIKYYPDQTLNPDGTAPYSAENFEMPAEGCGITAQEMSASAGASNYYSAHNEHQTGEQKYVPEASGYPFSQVEYTPDNTGRISRQGGVGTDFRLGSGHESKYYYGHPTQVELDRLFGSEVGDYSHYQKNMVVDPNGQVSLSYLDQEGRVIATSLAGESPDNLQPIKSNTDAGTLGAHLTAEMLTQESEANLLTNNGRSLEFSETFLIPSDNTNVEIGYTLESEPFTDECLIENVCFDCVYDLTIALIDECQTNLIDPGQSVAGKFTRDEQNRIHFEYLCDGIDDTYPESFILTLKTGSYQLSKTLTVSQAAIDNYWRSYSDPDTNTCWKTLAEFQDEYLEATDFTPCDGFSDCQECIDKLDQQNEIEHFTEEQYALMYQFCNRACESTSYCGTMMDILMSDVAPDGQYGQCTTGSGLVDPSQFTLSVYNHDNQLPLHTRLIDPVTDFWKHPRYNATTDDHYYDDQLNIAYVSVIPVFNELDEIVSCTPAADLSHIIDNGNNSYKVEPQYLTNVRDFMNEFEMSWAMSLIVYHPEYSYYASCKQNVMHEGTQTLFTSESFDALMSSNQTYAAAQSAGLLPATPTTTLSTVLTNYKTASNALMVWDPLIAYHTDHYNLLLDKLTNYATVGGNTYSAMDIAVIVAQYNGIPPTWGTSLIFGSGAYGDTEWNTFRSIYYSVKQDVFMHFANVAAVSGSIPGYNACIGDDSFDANLYDFSTPVTQPSLSTSEFFQFDQPCAIYFYELYREKTRRFGTADEMIDTDPLTVAYEQTSLNGICPIGNGLTAFLGNMASTDNLLTPTLELASNAPYIGFYGTLTDYTSYSPPSTSWSATHTGTALNISITSGSPAVTQHIDLAQQTGSTFNWSDVYTFMNMAITGSSGTSTTFTIQAEVVTSGGTNFYTVNGSTDYAITGCSAPDQCSNTKVGKDLKRLMNALNAAGQLFNTSPTQIKDAGNTNQYSLLVTDELQVAANGATADNFWWKYDNSGQNFLLYHTSGTELNIHLNGTISSGVVYTINSFLIFDDQQLLELDGDLNGLTEIVLEVNSVAGSSSTPVDLVDCEPYVPSYCQGTTFDNLPALKAVLNESFGVEAITHFNIMDNASMTNDLAEQLPFYGSDPSSYATISTEENGAETMTIDFTFQTEGDEIPIPYCPIVLTFDEAGHSWSDVTSVLSLHTTGDADGQGIYHVLTGQVTLSDNTVATIELSSCLGFNECVPCGESLCSYIVLKSCKADYLPYAPENNTEQCSNDINNIIQSYNSSANSAYWNFDVPLFSDENLRLYYALGACSCLTDYKNQLLLLADPAHSTDPHPVLFESTSCFAALSSQSCYEGYMTYYNAIHSTVQDLESFHVCSYADFISQGLCSCVNDYIDYIADVTPQVPELVASSSSSVYLKPLEMFCTGQNIYPPLQYSCNQTVIPDTMPSQPFTDPCHEYLENAAYANAENAYNEYYAAQYEQFVNAYVAHCMSATESLKRSYDEKEYHFTLYYYDQAGNLIRTIPPEGVEILNITGSDDALAVSIANDRLNGTQTVTTTHRLATTYVYNSLNQLVAQDMPDQDKMEDWSLKKPTGLYNGLITTAVQMVSANTGYLTGYVNTTAADAPMTTRGYLFTTADGGNSWTRVNNLLGTKLNKVVMPTNSVFVAVGEGGTALISRTGTDWDMINTYSAGIKTEFVDVFAEVNSSLLTARFAGADATVGLYTETAMGVGTILKKSMAFDSGYTGTITAIKAIEKTGSNYIYLVTVLDASGISYDIHVREIAASTTSATVVVQPENILGNPLNAVCYYSNTDGYAGGDNGNFVKLVTNGTTLQQYMLSSNVTGKFTDVWFADANTGMAVIRDNSTGNKYLYVTYSSGASWAQVETSPIVSADLAQLTTTSLTVAYLLQSGSNVIEKTRKITTSQVETASTGQSYSSNVPVTIGAALSTTSEIYSVRPNGTNKYNLYLFGVNSALGQILTDSGETPVKLTGKLLSGTYSKYVAVLTSTNRIHILYYKASNSTWATEVILSSTPKYTDMILNESGSFILAFDKNAQKLYRIPISATAIPTSADAVQLTTALSTSPTISAKTGMALCANRLTFCGQGGQLYTTDAISTSTTSFTWTDRSYLRFRITLNDMHPLSSTGYGLHTVGNNGMILSRNSTTGVWQVGNFQSLTDFTCASGYSSYVQVGGASGYGAYYNLSTSVLTSYAIPSSMSGYTFGSIATEPGGITYFMGNNGTAGGYVYATNPTSTWSTLQSTNVIYRSIQIVPVSGSSSQVAYAVGDDARIEYVSGTIQSAMNEVHPPRLNDVHFDLASTSQGTIVGDHFFIRNTKNNAVKWNYAVSSASSGFDKQLTKVWTLQSQIAGYMPSAIVGGAAYFGEMNAQSVVADATGTPALGTITDLQFFSSGMLGYFTDGTYLRNVTYTYSSGVYHAGTVSLAATASQSINGFHRFGNGALMVVGNSGLIGYRPPSGGSTFTSMNPGLTENFTDVYFTDFETGYIVGSAGALYRTMNPVTNSSDILQSTGWEHLDNIHDGIVTATSQCALNVITFLPGSATDAIVGGYYTPITYDNWYVRKFHIDKGQYSAKFWYDQLGRIVVSQNARQYREGKYSYTRYDGLGRVFEAGEKTENGPADDPDVPKFASIFTGSSGNPDEVDQNKLYTWLVTQAATSRHEVTQSYYDETNVDVGYDVHNTYGYTFNSETQRKRIVHVTYEEDYDNDNATYDHATHYDYDIHGNVKTLIQDNKKMDDITDIAANRFKRMDYSYDLISGNVHRVDYQTGMKDQWHHAYDYDADNRITDVYTTTQTPFTDPQVTGMVSSHNEPSQSVYWDKEATYRYYDHGPLSRIELGEEQVQGLDYYYTLQGWVKGVNSNSLLPVADPSGDGVAGSTNKTGRDAYGFSLSYFEGDYQSISGGMSMFPSGTPTVSANDLYNGNIGRMVTTITNPTTRDVLPQVSKYSYDQLNRLKESNSYASINASANSWQAAGTEKYRNELSYDANGNIVSQNRWNAANVQFDQLTYGYRKNSNGKILQNRLYSVNDANTTDVTPNELTNQSAFTQSSVNINSNYRYDEEGRLIADDAEKISKIVWRVDGKVKEIRRGTGTGKSNLRFDYDAMGHRIAKHVYDDAWSLQKSTYYILDAQGNTMGVYEREVDNETSVVTFALKEQYIYGSNRVGVRNTDINLLSTTMPLPASAYTAHDIGQKAYELTNHLGNVLSTISDKPMPHATGTTVDYFLADIRTSSDYYPFGSQQRERTFTLAGAEDFRFGFQNQEMDDEIKGEGNSVNFEYRMHDPRLGRFFAIDPLVEKYPWYSPYQFSGNKLIDHIELEGAEEYHYTLKWNKRTGAYQVFNFKQLPGSSLTLKTPFGEYVAYDAWIYFNGKVYHIHERWDVPGQKTKDFIKDPTNPKWEMYSLQVENEFKKMAVEGVTILFGGGLITKLLISSITEPSVPENNTTPEPPPTPATKSTTESTTGETFPPDRPLPRDSNGEPIVDPEAEGAPHTQLGTKQGRNGDYNQSREFDSEGNPVRDIDWTDHGRPSEHTNPHQHPYRPNPSGGSLQRGKGTPLN